MLAGVLLLVLCAAVVIGGFLGARFLVAPAGPKRFACACGFDQKPWKGTSFGRRAGFVVAGLVGYYLGASLLFAGGLLIGGKAVSDDASMRVSVAANGAAAAAGIQDGDRLVSIDGHPTTDWDTTKKLVAARPPGEPLTVVIDRAGQPLTLTPTVGANGRIGVGPPFERQRVGIGAALADGLAAPVHVWASTVKGFADIFARRDKVEAVGPVGIVNETKKSQTSGSGLQFVALLAAYAIWVPLIVSLVLFPRKRQG